MVRGPHQLCKSTAQHPSLSPLLLTPKTQLRDVSLSFGDKKMLSDFSYDFNKGDRIGIVGRNGVGKVSRSLGGACPCASCRIFSSCSYHVITKTSLPSSLFLFAHFHVRKSTFINNLSGDQAVDSGTIEAGHTVVFGKYDQMGIPFLNEAQSVLDFVKERVESSSGASMAEAPQEAMRLLKQFEFPRPRWNER